MGEVMVLLLPLLYARWSGPAVYRPFASTGERGGSTGPRFWLLFLGFSNFWTAAQNCPQTTGEQATDATTSYGRTIQTNLVHPKVTEQILRKVGMETVSDRQDYSGDRRGRIQRHAAASMARPSSTVPVFSRK